MGKWIAAAAALMAAAPLRAQPAEVDYRDAANWLCLPGRADACGQPLPTTALNANGYGSSGRSVADAGARADCFYVYPTVSRDPTMNSDLALGPEEQSAALVQFARFASACRTFAPAYRQATLASLAATLGGTDATPIMAKAYGDVRDAWRTYLRDHNDGRPFALIGHSQGSIHLIRLIQEEIEGRPEAKRMLSAILLGWAVEVPEGQKVGGTFRQTPLCSDGGQTGCVITYMAFRASAPPPPGSFLGRAVRPGMTAGCTNPALLVGGTRSADSYWFAATPPLPGETQVAWSTQGAPPTPFLRTEGLLSIACVNRGPIGYLSVLELADPSDARTDRIGGDVYLGGRLSPSWGLHRSDMNIAQGDLIRLVERQARAFAARN